jgi:hypothetical protein
LLTGGKRTRSEPQFAETFQNPPHQISVIIGDWKLILRGDSYEMYDLNTDPHETCTLVSGNPVRFGMLRGELFFWWKQANSKRAGAGKTAQIDPQTLEILKGLGYVQK